MAPTPSRKRKEPEAPSPAAAATAASATPTRKLTREEMQAARKRARLAMEQNLQEKQALRAARAARAAAAAVPTTEAVTPTFTSPNKKRRVGQSGDSRPVYQELPTVSAQQVAPATSSTKLTRQQQREIGLQKASQPAAEKSESKSKSPAPSISSSTPPSPATPLPQFIPAAAAPGQTPPISTTRAPYAAVPVAPSTIGVPSPKPTLTTVTKPSQLGAPRPAFSPENTAAARESARKYAASATNTLPSSAIPTAGHAPVPVYRHATNVLPHPMQEYVRPGLDNAFNATTSGAVQSHQTVAPTVSRPIGLLPTVQSPESQRYGSATTLRPTQSTATTLTAPSFPSNQGQLHHPQSNLHSVSRPFSQVAEGAVSVYLDTRSHAKISQVPAHTINFAQPSLSHQEATPHNTSFASNDPGTSNLFLPPASRNSTPSHFPTHTAKLPATASSISDFRGSLFNSPNHQAGTPAMLTPVIDNMNEALKEGNHSANMDSLANDLNLTDAVGVKTDSNDKVHGVRMAELQSEISCLDSIWKFLSAWAVLFVFFCFYFSSEVGKEVTPLSTATAKCFLDNVDHGTFGPDVCLESDIPCPSGGICMHGLLQDCSDSHYQVASYGDACILTKEANQTLAAAQKLLAGWTVEHMCAIQGCPFAHEAPTESTNIPWFSYSQMIGELGVEWDPDLFFLAAETFSFDKENEPMLIRLSDDFVKKSLSYPLWCVFARFCKRCFQNTLDGFFFLIWSLCEIATSFVMANPWLSAAMTAVVSVAMVRLYRYLEWQRKQPFISKARPLAYQLLKDVAPDKVPILHVRDDIAWQLFPNSEQDRTYFMKKVWRDVVVILNRDNRIAKATSVKNGVFIPSWQWQAVIPKKTTKQS